ncbi:MAG: 50S ribosomal protein L35ae [Candidatus Woesearchaeota archaeon]
MEGTINNYRQGRHTQKNDHILISVKGVESKEKAAKMIGKEVVWKSPAGKEIKGKVAAAHGNSGVIRVIFERSLPGQSIGTKVSLK